MTESKDHLPADRATPDWYRKPLLVIAAGLLLFLSLYLWVAPRIGFIGYGRDSFYLQDYAYHILLTNHFWFKTSGNIYDLGFQLQTLSRYMERPAIVAMPVAVTPIALVIWMPFAYIANFSLSLAYSLWVAFSLCILGLALWNAAGPRPHQLLPAALCGITLFSLTGVSAVIVGQTSLYAAGLLTFLVCRMTRSGFKQAKTAMDWPAVLLAVLTGMKPPYLIIGFVILLIYGRRREFLASVVMVMMLAAALTPLMTPEWPRSYISTLQMYGSGNFPDVYAWSIAPWTMNIFRSAVAGFIGDRTAAALSSAISAVVLSVMAIFFLLRPSPHTARASQAAVAVIACCLLFSPNSGAYEDILLIPAFVAVMVNGAAPPLLSLKGMAIAGALLLSLLHNVPGLGLNHYRLWIFFIPKLLVLAGMVYYAGAGRNPQAPIPGR